MAHVCARVQHASELLLQMQRLCNMSVSTPTLCTATLQLTTAVQSSNADVTVSLHLHALQGNSSTNPQAMIAATASKHKANAHARHSV